MNERMSDKLSDLIYGDFRQDITDARCEGEDQASYEGGLTAAEYRNKMNQCLREANRLLEADVVTTAVEIEAAFVYGFSLGYQNLIDFGYEYIHGEAFV